MIKKIGLTTIALTTLLLTGCGGGGSTSDSTGTNNNFSQSQRTTTISNKNYVLVLKNSPTGICETSEFRYELSKKLTSLVTEERANTATCRDYGKNNDGAECLVDYYKETGSGSGNVACVVGFNGTTSNYKQAKLVGDSSFMDIIDTTFIQVAE